MTEGDHQVDGNEVSGRSSRAESTVLDSDPDNPTVDARERYADRTRWLYTIFGVLIAVAVLYGFDLVHSTDRVPRGTAVAGVSVGGMQFPQAEEKLQVELGPRLDSPVEIRAGAVSTTLLPDDVGLSVDWPATLERAGSQPLNPFTRLFSLFFSNEVGIASIIPDERLTEYLEQLALTADFEPREGAIWFDEAEVRSTTPMDGQQLQVEPSRDQLMAHWLDEDGVDLVVEFTPTETDAEAVRTLVRDVAEPAVARSTTLVASTPTADNDEPPTTTMRLAPDPESNSERARDGRELELVDPRSPHALRVDFPRDRMGEYLSFVREGADLVPRYDGEAARGILEPLLEETEQEGRDASFEFSGDTVTVVPARQGRTVDWEPLLDSLPEDLIDTRGPRLVPVGYVDREPELSTADAEGAGIREVVGEFTIPVAPSAAAASLISGINGAFVPAGGSFSMREQASLQSGNMGADGAATALFNAAYEAGAQSIDRTSRGALDDAFPLARDASAASEIAFENAQGTGLVVRAYSGDDSVTVELWGTEEYEVSSSLDPRASVQSPEVRTVRSEDCSPSSGEDGFTATVTRTVERGDDVISTDRFSSTYPAQDRVVCAPPEPGDDGEGDEPPPPPEPGPPPGIDIPGLPRIPFPGN